MYIAHVVFGLQLAVIGSAFGRDRTTVAYACRTVEDARDQPAFDAALARLELSATIAFDQLEQEIAA
jgi:chromosomal replication initiation ATPase DnaA